MPSTIDTKAVAMEGTGGSGVAPLPFRGIVGVDGVEEVGVDVVESESGICCVWSSASATCTTPTTTPSVVLVVGLQGVMDIVNSSPSFFDVVVVSACVPPPSSATAVS